LCKAFGALQALDRIDLRIQADCIRGIIGPNGSGKTRLFNCITGMLTPDGGTVHFQPDEITGWPPQQIANRGIRRTFQAGKLIPGMTVIENVMSGISDPVVQAARDAVFRLPFVRSRRESEIRAQAQQILRMVGLESAAERWAGDLVWTERQLVQIARALIAKPRLLLLDEPASGMGLKEMEHVEDITRRIREMGVTIAVVSHDVMCLLCREVMSSVPLAVAIVPAGSHE
jgi:branched-chain amino acid transport system ATP-binding protein